MAQPVSDVTTAIAALRLPWGVRRTSVDRLWRAIELEADVLGEHALRVLQRRSAVIDARASGVLTFDGMLIAALGAVYALDLLDRPIEQLLAAASAVGLLLTEFSGVCAAMLACAVVSPYVPL